MFTFISYMLFTVLFLSLALVLFFGLQSIKLI